MTVLTCLMVIRSKKENAQLYNVNISKRNWYEEVQKIAREGEETLGQRAATVESS